MKSGERDVRAAEFFSALFEPADIVEVRALPSRRQMWMEADQLHKTAMLDGQNWYFGANPRRERGAADANGVALARCVFVDFDHIADPLSALSLVRDAGLPQPTATLTSGRGVHCYWRLSEPMTDLAAWSRVQRGLIGLLGSDKAIHDAPRIMRMPGSINSKNGHAAAVFECEPERVYAVAEFPVGDDDHRTDRLPSVPVVGGGDMAGLSRRTLIYLQAGAGEGMRNAELFAAACDLCGSGFPEPTAQNMLLAPSERCGLDQVEVYAAIRSAYSKMRVPAKPPEVDPAAVWGDVAGGASVAAVGRLGDVGDRPQASPKLSTQTAAKVAGNKLANDPDVAASYPTESARPPFSNVFVRFEESVVKTKDGSEKTKVERKLIHKSAQLCFAEMQAATDRWPRCIGSQPFIVTGTGLNQAPHMFRSASDLFGWLHSKTGLFWTEKACYDGTTHDERTAMGKGEFFDFLRVSDEIDRYLSFSAMPHEPPMAGVYYPPLSLPEPTYERLNEFVDRLNPETDDDRRLLLALMLTPGAGLAPGTRPLFVLTSNSGQGSGKTATVRAISDIWGGACDLDYTQEWGELSKRIMSSDDAFSRIMLFDNVKGSTFGTGTLEAAITAKTICGWKAYVGQVSRPNDATFVVTFNDPALTRDLTERAVVIKIGTQRHQFDFVTWAANFVAEHRAQLVADCMGMLRAPSYWTSGGLADRFQVWQRNVLAKVPGTEQMAKLIMDRRADVDADSDAASGVMEALVQFVQAGIDDGHEHPEHINTIEVHRLMVQTQIWVDDPKVSGGQNKANAVKRAKRILSGRNVLTPVIGEDGRQMNPVVFDDGIRTRAALYRINIASLPTDQSEDIPL